MPYELSAEELATVVRAELARADAAPIVVYWYRLEGDREVYASALTDALADLSASVAVVRGVRFDNPNAVMDDLLEILESNRHAIRATVATAIEQGRGGCLVLLARTELNVPQLSSPVKLPDWFPGHGGQIVSVVITDFSWTASLPVNSEATCIAELADCLFQLDRTLVGRLTSATHSPARARTNSLLDHLRTDGETWSEILAAAHKSLADVTSTRGFRPSVRGHTIVCKLWSLAQRTSPDLLPRISKALAEALLLGEAEASAAHESLSAVLRRPPQPYGAKQTRFAANLISSATATCQLLTAAAHADDYSTFPAALLRSTANDLRCALIDAEFVLRSED